MLSRRGAGAVERDGLENRCACKRTEGSNPSLSVGAFANSSTSASKHQRGRRLNIFSGMLRMIAMMPIQNHGT